MKFSVNWLKQWAATDLDAEALGERLTEIGLEVDSITPVSAPFQGVVVAEIVDCQPHPDADKLKLCQVNTGEGEPLQVVCGAPNARVGLKAPFARIGAVLGEDFKIKKAKLRGVESHGMLCSGRELGLSEDHDGLMALPEDAPVGEDFRAFLSLDDHSIEIDLTPNRADCLSIRGLARDISAATGSVFTPVDPEPVKAQSERQFEVRLDADSGCLRFAGRVIEGINASARTPMWMQEALRRSGIRPISPVVDVTQYVMLEQGQPMHGYDLDKLRGAIHVRRASQDEELTLLDGKDVSVDPRVLVISDDNGAIGLGGIMGGLSTAVDADTRNIFLEAAFFDPAVIMGRARNLGMHTDASHRFERGVDPSGQERAIERATGLLLELVGGTPGPLQLVELRDELPERQPVSLRLARLNRVLGSDLSADDVEPILERLGMRGEGQGSGDGQSWTVTAPSSRFDIAIEEDLIEEVARIYGYNRLPTCMPAGEIPTPVMPERELPLTRLQAALCDLGYQEAINYSFVDEAWLERCHMATDAYPLANPLSTEMNVMRTSLLPGLLQALASNQRRQQSRIRLFETGVSFQALSDGGAQETRRLALVAAGTAAPEQWGESSRALDFFDLKGDLEALCQLRGWQTEVTFQPARQPWLHPGQSAELLLDGQNAGWLGALHPALVRDWDLRGDVFVAEIELDQLCWRQLPQAQAVSRYPSIRRDLSLLVPESVSYDELSQCIRNQAGEWLKDLLIFDSYSGQSVEKTYKSLSIGLILQDVSSTLTDEVVETLQQKIVSTLKLQLNARLRG